MVLALFSLKYKKIRRPFIKKQFQRRFDNRPRSNEQIRVPEVRLIDQNGDNLGVVSTSEALQKAKEAGLDLIEIAKDAKPPVAKIIDMGKYLYQQEKTKREQKAKQKTSELKIVKVGLSTSEHDSMTKIKKLEKFLEAGHKVKVEIFLKGRQRANKDFAQERFNNFLSLIQTEHKVDQPLRKLPSGFSIILTK